MLNHRLRRLVEGDYLVNKPKLLPMKEAYWGRDLRNQPAVGSWGKLRNKRKNLIRFLETHHQIQEVYLVDQLSQLKVPYLDNNQQSLRRPEAFSAKRLKIAHQVQTLDHLLKSQQRRLRQEVFLASRKAKEHLEVVVAAVVDYLAVLSLKEEVSLVMPQVLEILPVVRYSGEAGRRLLFSEAIPHQEGRYLEAKQICLEIRNQRSPPRLKMTVTTVPAKEAIALRPLPRTKKPLR